MAAHNYVNLLGLVRQAPQIQNGAYGSVAFCPVTVIRGNRDNNFKKVDAQTKYSTPIVMSEEETAIDEIATWQVNDIVRVVGFIATREIEKKACCPSCGHENSRKDACASARSGGNRVFIFPVYVERVESFHEQGDAHRYLIEREEISNRVFLLGRLTREPVQGDADGRIYTRYQLAINRKYCPPGFEEVLERTDYPWVYSYGENARKDFLALHVNARVYVDGALQTRKYKETYSCQVCGEEFPVTGKTLEILSYETEYLSDYDEEALRNLEES